MAHGIFISYRREDSIGYAGRIYDRLSKHFGKDCVFMDIDTIAPGDDFVEAINRTCASCGVLLALIGKSWATVTDRNGRRRLDNPNDFVRMETAKALASGIRVIPVLLDEAEMPDPQALPEDLQKLAHRHAFHISSLRFHPDVDRLIDAIERSLAASQASASAAAAPAVPALFVPSAAQARLEEEGRQAAEQARLEDERKRAAEQARLEEGRKQAAEQARLDKERKQAAERARREKEVAQRAAEQPRREQNRKRDHEEIIEPPAFSNAPARPVIELEPLPPKTLKIWTPSGEIEVVREQRQYGKTPQADTDRGTIDSEERSRIVEPRSEPSTPAARGHEDETSAQGVPARKWAKALLTLFGLLIVIWGVHSALFPSGKLQIGWKAQTSGTSERLHSVAFATPQSGWAVGFPGTILHTEDGGNKWKQQRSGTCATLESVVFATPQSGWAVGWSFSKPAFMYEAILHTEDGGTTWRPQTSDTPNGFFVKLFGTPPAARHPVGLKSVSFTTPQSGWAVGLSGTILHTEDAGATWKLQSSGSNEYLLCVTFVTPQSAWVVGTGGTILHTEDGGGTWKKQRSGTSAALESVVFATPQSGWAVGDKGTILHTEDGGASWRPRTSGTTVALHSVAFTALQSGWAVGDKGTILQTEDSGVTWKQQASGTGEDLISVAFASPQAGWVVGDKGTILHRE